MAVTDDVGGPFGEDVRAFFNSQFADDPRLQVPVDELRWKLGDGNPAGRGLVATARLDDELVGLLTATPKRGRLAGSPLGLAEMGDVLVRSGVQKSSRAAEPMPGTADDDVRNRSLFTRLALELSAALPGQGVDLVFGTPNEQALPGWVRRIGYLELEGLGLRSWHRPARGALPAPPVVARAGLAAFGLLARPIRPPRWHGLELDELDLRRDDVDELWSRCSPGSGVEVVQDAPWFQHRFADRPGVAYDLHAVRRRGRLVGVVVGRAVARATGHTTYCVGDWLLDDDHRHLLAVAIGELARRRSGAVDTVSLWTDGSSLSSRSLRRLGFVRSRSVPVVVAPNEVGSAVAADRRPWDLRVGWSDNV